MSLGQRIKQARLDAGLSQRQLCGQTITRNMLSQIENGSAHPSMATLQHLASQLDKPISYFLEEASVSPNQTRMDAARAAFVRSDPAAALKHLAQFTSPDPVFDAEKHLLEALCCILLAENQPNIDLLQQAAAAGAKTPYYTPQLERRRLLCLTGMGECEITAILPGIDQDLLTLAKASLAAEDLRRCLALLNAVSDQDRADWLRLRADVSFASGDYAEAAQYYTRICSPSVYPLLEQCYQKLEDYKMAYHYACLQR